MTTVTRLWTARAPGTIARRKKILELAQDVLRPFAEFCPFLDQFMTALAARRVDPARHGKDLAPVLVREMRRNQRATRQVRLDHHRAKRHPRDDAVADGKGLFVRSAVKGKLRDDSPIGRNSLE